MGKTSYRFNRTQSSGSKKTWSWILVLIILICVYIGIFHSHRYYGFDLVLWLVIIGPISLLGLDTIWFDHGKWDKLISFLLFLFIGGPITALVIFLHNVYIDKLLTGHAIHVNGLVKELYVIKGKNIRIPYAVFTYQVKGKIWMQEIDNNENPLMIGDTVKLVCSELDPEVFIRLEE